MAPADTEKTRQLDIPPELNPPRPVDEVLAPDEFGAITVFAAIKDPRRRKELDRRVGRRSAVLRYYDPGETVIIQGEAGETAFYVLTEEDVIALRKHQLTVLDSIAAAEAAPPPEPEEGDGKKKKKKAKGDDPLDHRLALLSPSRREALRAGCEEEIARREAFVAQIPDEDDRPPAATAWLLTQGPEQDAQSTFQNLRKRARALANKLFGAFRKRVRRDERAAVKSIPIDAMTDIDAETMRGSIGHGEVFGESSCLQRAPRSATVVANEPVYMVEMLRNVYDQLHLDETFRETMRAKYIERVLGSQLRRLSVFEKLTDEQFDWLLDKRYDRLDWVDRETGDVLFEQGQQSDCIHIIHKGLVKVLANVRARFLVEDFDGTPGWGEALERAESLIAESDAAAAAAAAGDEEAVEALTEWPARLRDAVAAKLREVNAEFGVQPGQRDADATGALLEGLNRFVENGNLVASRHSPKAGRKDPRWLSSKDILANVGDSQLEALFKTSSNDTESWSQLELWLFHRRMLELALAGAIPERTAGGENRRVLAYLGPGQVLGEIGVMQDVMHGPGTGLRTATCVAYDHPDRPSDDIRFPDASRGAITHVELISVSREIFGQLVDASPEFREGVEEIIAQRKRRSAPPKPSIDQEAMLLPTIESQRFDDLGLVQGQQLMLIDLDRCTRCNACVEACIKSHDDGRTRLFLDGPQFQSYLVPLTCRSCMDPVCMIGCPVGSINRGDEGEIVIEPWCIGCNLCANQCPYGSIQMEPLSDGDAKRIEDHAKNVFVELGERVEDIAVRLPKRQAVVCDLCGSSSSPGPACVRACPHEAAIRVPALSAFETRE